ncbi:hypothetical protein LMH87_004304 [Akanthomyces muscarius]|uniref:Uncharacterized protein n=1 Tax=Akanthomyces muscarius TaxID=2231603 RepID=A0A9W8UHY4_AKAMU|nr:hypothetical protein LMH87_004304 [Akanthomyces muscarius]KAJ4145454.1 hypothetical protein LMH87_004304 [Akanthomyces muscarius]
MSQTTSAILSSVPAWYFDSEGRYIVFREDGTGELWCACNFNYWIAADIEWKSAEISVAAEAQAVGPSATASAADAEITSQLQIQMTLTKRLPQKAQSSILTQSTLVNEYSLTDEAYKTKSYTVRVEKGRFMEPCRVGYADESAKKFNLRLVFDPSPYPPKSEWKSLERGVEDGHFWNHTQFVASST